MTSIAVLLVVPRKIAEVVATLDFDPSPRINGKPNHLNNANEHAIKELVQKVIEADRSDLAEPRTVAQRLLKLASSASPFIGSPEGSRECRAVHQQQLDNKFRR